LVRLQGPALQEHREGQDRPSPGIRELADRFTSYRMDTESLYALQPRPAPALAAQRSSPPRAQPCGIKPDGITRGRIALAAGRAQHWPLPDHGGLGQG
jgi:hypothetical protein